MHSSRRAGRHTRSRVSITLENIKLTYSQIQEFYPKLPTLKFVAKRKASPCYIISTITRCLVFFVFVLIIMVYVLSEQTVADMLGIKRMARY